MKNLNIFGKDKDVDKKDRVVDDRIDKIVDDKRIDLRGEELDIRKNRVKVGEVEFGKEIIEELKEVDVPVKHEEIVIERHAIGNEPTDSSIDTEEIIRIPVSREVVDIGKHTVVTGEVTARKKEVEDTEHVSQTLKKEQAHIYKDGNANVISDITDNSSH